ncbi:hypothetical protein KAU33_09750 [Candidatus Dependentiae bacterium]|nr:hypothetical protein [Candidatus Dependentiae bacterium]
MEEGLDNLSSEEKELILEHRNKKKNEDEPVSDRIKKREKEIYDHQHMMEEEAKRSSKQLTYSLWGILAFIIVSITAIVLYITKSRLMVPLLIMVVLAVILLIIWLIISAYQCPSCKRHFARQGKEYFTSYQNTTTVRLQSGGTGLQTNTVRVYKVHCKYCGHEWVILR